ncbi:MAG: hypothetical protein AAFX93_00050 [Verrucomicrobiota bacterium]
MNVIDTAYAGRMLPQTVPGVALEFPQLEDKLAEILADAQLRKERDWWTIKDALQFTGVTKDAIDAGRAFRPTTDPRHLKIRKRFDNQLNRAKLMVRKADMLKWRDAFFTLETED